MSAWCAEAFSSVMQANLTFFQIISGVHVRPPNVVRVVVVLGLHHHRRGRRALHGRGCGRAGDHGWSTLA